MTLIADLDRPRMSLFSQNRQMLVEMANRLDGGDYWEEEAHQDR